MSQAIEVFQLSKTFDSTVALNAVSSSFNSGEMVALIGPSGSGKSTLLRHLAGLETSDRQGSGEVKIAGQSMQKNGRLARDARRIRSNIGFIFQQFNLIGRLSVKTNVLLGCLGHIPAWRGCLGLFSATEQAQALDALARVGLKSLSQQRASTLSGGQQQRVAIARTLMQQANIVLADEPIASLDPKSAKIVMQNLRDMRAQDGRTVVVTLHQVEYARKYCQRVVALIKGEIAFDGKVTDLTDAVLQKLYGTEMSETHDDLFTESLKPPVFQEPVLVSGMAG